MLLWGLNGFPVPPFRFPCSTFWIHLCRLNDSDVCLSGGGLRSDLKGNPYRHAQTFATTPFPRIQNKIGGDDSPYPIVQSKRSLRQNVYATDAEIRCE